jgi:predicted SAM-dependent methyltransferase
METININPEEIIKSEIKRHSNAKKRQITKDRKSYRLEDISIIKKYFPDIKDILCIGARDDQEVLDFINNGFPETIGIDISNETNLIKRIDAHKLNEHFDKFDLVYTSHCLEHMYSIYTVLSNIRKLNPKGILIILPLQEKSVSLKHSNKFGIMGINNQNDSIKIIEEEKKDIFENPHKHKSMWDDFKELGKFELLYWKFRQGLNMKEKEILICLQLNT